MGSEPAAVKPFGGDPADVKTNDSATAAKLLFDSHTHINYEDYSVEARVEVMDRTEASAVAYVVDVGFSMDSSRQAIADAADRTWCYAAVGVHPHDADTFTDDDLTELRLMAKAPRVVAYGEIGLDYYRDYSLRENQKVSFRKQLRLAFETGLPIIIHDRDSAGETMEILKSEGAFSAERIAAFPANPVSGLPDARILLHCFSGSAEQAVEYAGIGCTISVAGPVTFKNNKKTGLVASAVPLGNLLIETDTPFMAPEPFRGQRNEPAHVEFVARRVAELRGLTYEELAAATTANAKRFYSLE